MAAKLAAQTRRATVGKPTGRPRDRRLDAAVLEATRRMLLEVGYRDLSIEAVARRAGVHRPAIYRRWRSKAQLVHAAIYPAGDVTMRVPDTGDFARDLRTCIANAIGLFSRPEVMAAVPGLMADVRDDALLQRRLVPRLEASARTDFARLLARAIDRGEARPGIDAEMLFDAFAGAVLLRIATGGPRALDGMVDALTTLLLSGAGTTHTRR
jgi:AcrR family transcriptional regulator